MHEIYGWITISLFWLTFVLGILMALAYQFDWRNVFKFCDKVTVFPLVLFVIFGLFTLLAYVGYQEQIVGSYKITLPSYEIAYEDGTTLQIGEETKYYEVERGGDANEIEAVDYVNLVEELKKEE